MCDEAVEHDVEQEAGEEQMVEELVSQARNSGRQWNLRRLRPAVTCIKKTGLIATCRMA